jgi:Xaa-Pro aminopeptidase
MTGSWRETEEGPRLERLRALMARRGLDAVMIVGGPNLTYYSGFAGVERSMARAMIWILPRSGAPHIVAHTFRKHLVERHSWVESFGYFTRLARAPVQEVRTALAAMGVASGRVGMELGHESQLQLPQLEFERLRDGLAGTEIVDIAEDLWRLRAVRSGAELARQRKAGAIVAAVFEECWAFIRPGMTQSDLSGFIQRRLLDHGSGPSFAIISAGTENYDFCGAWTPDHRFSDGEMVWMDIGASSGGYAMLFSRAGVLGGPSAQQAATAAAVHAATMAGVRAVRPGVPMAEIAEVCARALAAVDAPVRTDIAELGTRYGHGVGMDFIEPPHVADYETWVLEPGMVFAIEPGISTDYGRFHFREVVVVTEDGVALFPAPPAELATIPNREAF